MAMLKCLEILALAIVIVSVHVPLRGYAVAPPDVENTVPPPFEKPDVPADDTSLNTASITGTVPVAVALGAAPADVDVDSLAVDSFQPLADMDMPRIDTEAVLGFRPDMDIEDMEVMDGLEHDVSLGNAVGEDVAVSYPPVDSEVLHIDTSLFKENEDPVPDADPSSTVNAGSETADMGYSPDAKGLVDHSDAVDEPDAVDDHSDARVTDTDLGNEKTVIVDSGEDRRVVDEVLTSEDFALSPDFAAALEELGGVGGVAFDSGADVEMPIVSSEPTAEDTAATLEGFDATDNIAAGGLLGNIATEADFDNEEMATEARFPIASIDEGKTPENVETSNGNIIQRKSGVTQPADVAEIIDVTEETFSDSLESDSLENDDKLDSVADPGMEAVIVGDEAIAPTDNTVNEVGPIIDSVTAPSGFQSFIDETPEAESVDMHPVVEAIMSGSQAISTPVADLTGNNSLETLAGQEVAAEASSKPNVTSNAEGDVEGAEMHDNEGNDYESPLNKEVSEEVLDSSTSEGMKNYASMFTVLVVAITTAVASF